MTDIGFDPWAENAIVAARTALSTTAHAGRVSACLGLNGAFTLFPLCALYRKPGGGRLAKHQQQGTPQLVRNMRCSFASYVAQGARVCPHCLSVFRAESAAESPAGTA